jgi:hypothetical protein
MKKILTCIPMLLAAHFATAQFSFSDNFEGYTAGTYLGANSSTWTTWSGTEGGAEDVLVTNANAHGGSNSVYYSSVAANGGPIDCVLPFGAQFTTGTFTLDFWLFVNSGKNAYFNIQQNPTIGQVWNSDWNFNADGTLEVINQQGLSFSTTYTMGAWSHIVITAQLNNSQWNVNIDGMDMGTFHNTSLGIASIDIYPINGSQFYIDDIAVTHVANTPTTNDIAVSYLTVPGGLSGSTVNVKALLRNIGSTTVANPYVSLYHNGTLIGSQTYTGLNLASMDTQIVSLTNPITFTSSNTISLDAQVASGTANDDNTLNDTVVYNYTAIVPAAGKLVVGEEATGTWCQWCPRGAVFMDQLSNTYAGFFQGIAVHNNDPMEVVDYDAGIGTLIGGYPSALVDRLPDVDPSAMEADFITRIQMAPKAMIVNGAQWNATNDTIMVSLTTTFAQAVASGNYKVACVIIEDNVTGTGSGYNQVNAYSGGGNGVMGGYETLPNPVPAAQMEYDFVARAIVPSFAGLSNAFTIPAAIGYVKTHNFSFAVPATWNKPDLKIVGLFIDNTGKIDNASSTTINDAITNGYVNGTSVAGVDNESLINQMALFPNPTSDISTLKFSLSDETEVVVNISSIDGKRISSHNYGSLTGTQNIEISTQGWANGIYLVEISAGKSSKIMKLSVQ